jgi:hypothetical protein
MELPQELTAHLQSHPVCATALALKRAVEVTYGRPDATTSKMVEFLLQAQEADGSFGFAPLPTACALAALHSIQHLAPMGSLPANRPQTIHQAYADAQSAMLTLLNDEAKHGMISCPPQQTQLLIQSEALDWAFVLLLLSDDPQMANQPAVEQWHHWFNQYQHQLPPSIVRIWQRTCWAPAANSQPRYDNITAQSSHGRETRQPSRPAGPTHGRFHQSPRSHIRRSARPVRHEQSQTS